MKCFINPHESLDSNVDGSREHLQSNMHKLSLVTWADTERMDEEMIPEAVHMRFEIKK